MERKAEQIEKATKQLFAAVQSACKKVSARNRHIVELAVYRKDDFWKDVAPRHGYSAWVRKKDRFVGIIRVVNSVGSGDSVFTWGADAPDNALFGVLRHATDFVRGGTRRSLLRVKNRLDDMYLDGEL